MSGFTALNVESEDTFEEEVDDTKEIQLEEALKLYQNALKLHSQGPAFSQEASAAYKELLQSEVFKYPEVVSDFAHDELDEAVAAGTHPDVGAVALLPANAAESSASSIPQLIYLTFKNRGQFVLDVARHQLPDKQGSRAELCRYYAGACAKSIADFAKALERDDTDLDLWKKAARVADVLLSTQRIARFCIESVLAGDDDDTDQAIDLSGLDEAFAAGELEEVIRLLQDDLTCLQKADSRPKPHLLAALRKTNDPYPFLPKRSDELEYVDDRYRPLSFGVRQLQVKPASSDLASLGDALYQTIQAAQEGGQAVGAATIIRVQLPASLLRAQNVEMTIESVEATIGRGEPHPPPDRKDGSPIQPPVESTINEGLSADKGSLSLESASQHEHQDEQIGDMIEVAGCGDTGADELRTIETSLATGVEPSARKRSATAAGNDEPEGRAKSKRLRARESMADLAAQEDEAVHDDPQYFLDQLAFFEQADQAAFDVVNSILAKMGLKFYLSTEDAKDLFWQSQDDGAADPRALDNTHQDSILLADLKAALLNWADEKAHATINGHGNHDFTEKSTGMSLFLQHSKSGLADGGRPTPTCTDAIWTAIASTINAQPTNIYDGALCFLSSLLLDIEGSDSKSLYLRESWPPELKDNVIRIISIAHSQIYEALHQRYLAFSSAHSDHQSRREQDLRSLFQFVQCMFELHLDSFLSVISPSSELVETTRILAENRLTQWANLADDTMNLFLDRSDNPELDDPLVLRFIWASTTCATQGHEVDKPHVVLCLQDLRLLLERSQAPSIMLPNSTAMPVLSIAAIDQEISRLSTLDFFTGVFDTDNSDPVAVIEKLEPILEQFADNHVDDSAGSNPRASASSQVEELINFLESGDASLTLFLWRRLQNAYTAISYTPKVVSCLLRSLETTVNELYTLGHLSAGPSTRQTAMLKWLRDADELMAKLLPKIMTDNAPFECVDQRHLHSSLVAVTSIARLIHGFVIYEDSIRVGQTAPAHLKGAASIKLFDKSKDRLREMLVRTWTLQYLLLKEATVQEPSLFPRASDDLAELLATVHHSIGIRHYCKYAGKAFIKLVKSELATLKTEQDHTADMIQVFYDLYQLRFTSGIGDISHGCPTENLDRKTAWSLIPTIMAYASKYNVKDLARGELKATIDKIQSALGTTKSPPPLVYNRRIISGYLKSVIKSDDLYRCIRGLGDLPTREVHCETEVAASHGWYFLLGYMALVKYKSIKRVSPTPTDDLDTAASLLRQDLDHGINKWETWYRLAQVYEAKIEDDLIWNSTKLNESRADIALLERQAIHSYIMATAIALRLPKTPPDAPQKIENMLAEFATRLYASSRPPLNMEAFRTDKNLRHMSSSIDMTMSKQPFHTPVHEYALWKFAAYLLSRKFTEKPKHWTTHYTRGKCLWKMFTNPQNAKQKRPVTAEGVLEAITEAVEALPKKEKSSDPILEPHFKLVSVVHKLVTRHGLSHSQAEEFMQATRYTHGIRLSDEDDEPDWVPYMLEILKKLGHADKSNWHHRIIDRAAHVIYDDSPTVAGALGAKHQFTQQIFTKTMTIQVWKPENERPGRHYVYTGRYVTFFVRILEQLNDRTNLDQLVRRIRRKTTDFLDHAKIWEEVTTAYVRLLRRHGNIPDGRERALFDGMNHEEFTKRSEKVETWALDPDTNSVALDIMRDGIDLKRLNNSLMKGPLIDDLIGDAYACLYEEFIAQLPRDQQPQPQPAPLPQGTFINMTTDRAPTTGEDSEHSRLNDLLRAQGDGTTEGPLALSVSAPVGLGLQGSSTPLTVPPTQAIPEVHRVPGRPGRTKTVTRREIQRKAEAAIAKPPPIKTPILSKRSAIEIVVRASHAESPIDRRSADAKQELQDSRASSRRGSYRDSADREDDSGSELSELDDLDDEKKQLFAEFDRAKENADDTADDVGEDAGEDGADDAGDEGGEDSLDEHDNDEEEIAEVEDDGEAGGEEEGEGEIEIPDSQAKDSQGEEDEFHEAREQNDGDEGD